MSSTASEHIRPIDQAVLDLLRQHSGLTVQELTQRLDVTATAVRQRLERLFQLELLSRSKESSGRGRPQFRYCLTPMGMRLAAASYADLATALWQELMDLPNPQQRNRVLRRVARRMGTNLSDSVPQSGDLDQRLEATASALGKRKVPAAVNYDGQMPVLEVQACPFPELAEHDDARQLCELEQEMLSQAMGQSVQLGSCRLDGHDCCQFRPIPGTEVQPAASLPVIQPTSTDETSPDETPAGESLADESDSVDNTASPNNPSTPGPAANSAAVSSSQ